MLEKGRKVTYPRYQQIAADVASKIVDKHYKVGEKIYARSSLASQYGVSAETARRAICVLSDMKIVESVKGSGIRIMSYEKAVQFVKQYQDIQSVNDIRRDIFSTIDRLSHEHEELKELVLDMIDRTERFKSINPFIPFEIRIENSSCHIGKTISDLNFWHNTSATIIGIRRNDEMIMSPGPYATVRQGDILYYVGEDSCQERVSKFLYQSSE